MGAFSLSELLCLTTVFAIVALALYFVSFVLKWIMKQPEGNDAMKAVANAIREGADAFLVTQYKVVAMISLVVAATLFFIYLFFRTPTDGIPLSNVSVGLITALAFLFGAACSALSGYLGMWVSVRANVRACAAAARTAQRALRVCLCGGIFSGVLIVSLSLLGLAVAYTLIRMCCPSLNAEEVPSLLVGYGFGASFVALFAQLGGGIYTKAADVGADIVGKIDLGIPEDDPRNPAVVADLVGDNVGDCAGRGADLFESTAAENIGAMVLGGIVMSECNPAAPEAFLLFPLFCRALALVASIGGALWAVRDIKTHKSDKKKRFDSKQSKRNNASGSSNDINTALLSGDKREENEIEYDDESNAGGSNDDDPSSRSASSDDDPMKTLNNGYYACVVLCLPLFFLAARLCLYVNDAPHAWLCFAFCGVVGIVLSFVFLLLTEYYTECRHTPVKSIAEASTQGHGTNIITGLAVGLEATAGPAIAIAIALLAAFALGKAAGLEQNERQQPQQQGGYDTFGADETDSMWMFSASASGIYGTACATMGMLAPAAYLLAMDTFGPIADNAGGIAEMSGCAEWIRARVDALDAAGNTTKALTKGYAVGSAALASFLLFSAFLDAARDYSGVETLAVVDIATPEVFCGAFFGVALVFLFSALAIQAVGTTAQLVVCEVKRQFRERPGIIDHTERPEYGSCVAIVTRGALREMVYPCILVLCVPVAVGTLFRYLCGGIVGVTAVAALLAASTAGGVLLGLVLNTAGGAWDNAKKLIETGEYGGKGSIAHQSAVSGDTVGDPCKDTAGPSLHVLVKLVASVTLVLHPMFIAPKGKPTFLFKE